MAFVGARRALLARKRPAAAAVAASPTLTYIGTSPFTAASGAGSATGVNIGTPAADRLVVVVVYFPGNNTSGTGLTIGGSSAALAVEGVQNGSLTDIYYLAVPSGTAATIAWTGTNSANNSGRFDIYSITGQSSNTPTGAGSNAASPGTTTLTTNNFSTSSGGVVVVGSYSWFQTTTDVITGTTGTITIDNNSSAIGGVASSASVRSIGTSSTSNYTATWDVSSNASSIAAAAWR